MLETSAVTTWARELASELEEDMEWVRTEEGNGYWNASSGQAMGKIQARVTASIDFFERFSGVNSKWTRDATDLYVSKGFNKSTESGARYVGDLLREWAKQVDSERLRPQGLDSFNARTLASTDLMEQVRLLNEESSVSPAAPVVLAGAALEIALKELVDQLNISVDKPSITGYSNALRAEDVISKQDKKDLDQIGGVRNDAAHGNHAQIDRERSVLVETQVNYMLRVLGDRLRARM